MTKRDSESLYVRLSQESDNICVEPLKMNPLRAV